MSASALTSAHPHSHQFPVDIHVEPKYGYVIKHTIAEFKMIFAQVLLANLTVLPLVRIPYRVCALISGDFYRSGRRKAEIIWKFQKQAWTLTDTSKLPPPSIKNFYKAVVIHSACDFAKNVAKIVFYPLAIIAHIFIAAYGVIINPLHVYSLYGKIENVFSRDLEPLDFKSFPFHTASFFMRKYFDVSIPFQSDAFIMSEYLAPCMQPKDVWDKHNIYGSEFVKDYHPHTLRSLLRSVKETLLINKDFFSKEKLPVDNLLEYTADLRSNISLVSQRDTSEISYGEGETIRIEEPDPNFKAPPLVRGQTPYCIVQQAKLREQQATRYQLIRITQHLAKIQEERKKLFEKLSHSYSQKDGLAAHHKVVFGILIDASEGHISRIMKELTAFINQKHLEKDRMQNGPKVYNLILTT